MFADPLLATVNVILVLGIVLAIVASFKLRKMNAELHAKNQRSRLTSTE